MENFFIKYVTNNFHKFLALLFGIAAIILFFSWIDSFATKIIINPRMRYGLYSAVVAIWINHWLFYKFEYPKNKKGKIGLVLAIYAENIYEEIRLKNDFVKKLQSNINQENFSELINIIVLKNHLSENIKTNKDILKLAVKTKGHFFLYGDVRKRQDEGGKYFLNLEGLVIHKPINIYTSLALKNDFVSLLPKEISFLETFEFKGFQLTADIIYLCVKYITGLAAYLSGDPWTAIKLHTNLKEKFNKFRPLPENLQSIRNKIPIILSNEKLSIARYFYLKNDIGNSTKYLSDSLSENNTNYGSWLLKAIQDFKVRDNPKEALESVKRAKEYSNGQGHWRYSRAFLLFWLGRYKEALSLCKKIKDSSYVGEEITMDEVENFNLELLKENGKSQLYFWLGYFNYKKKQNYPKSLEYFEKFESGADDTMGELKQKSSAYLIEIKKKMNLPKASRSQTLEIKK